MAECCYADCRLCLVSFMLSVTNKPFMLRVVMLNVIMLSVVMLNVIMLSVVMLSIVAPLVLLINQTFSQE
jgi:hypothetical protein